MIPIDNRPVCYCLPKQIAKFSGGFELLLPPRKLLGGLNTQAKSEKILDWLNSIPEIEAAVISLDTIAYGGLIASRRSSENFAEIEKCLSKLKKIIREKRIKTYAFSSIMRISDNNINEEEKEYWNLWGKKIFEYSYNFHKTEKKDVNGIPAEVLVDYLATRARNFRVNKTYLKWLEDGTLSCLIYSKDDCAQFGLNVKEAKALEEEIIEKNLPAMVKTGADEIPLTLLARVIPKGTFAKIKIYPQFTRPDEAKLISKYEDVSLLNSVKGQIELCGGKVAKTQEEAQIVLIINNFKKEQGELVMGVATEPFKGDFELPRKPYAIADVLNANGADNEFVKTLMSKKLDWENFLGYGGWNTSANTLGSVLCAAMVKFLASNCDLKEFKKQQLTRFLDDWAYQANVREKLKKTCIIPCPQVVKKEMKPFEEKLFKWLKIESCRVSYDFPWNRFFEIEIVIS